MMGKMLYCLTFPKHDLIELSSIAFRHTWWFLTDDTLVNFSYYLAVHKRFRFSIGPWVENSRITFWNRRLRVSRHAVFVFQVP